MSNPSPLKDEIIDRLRIENARLQAKIDALKAVRDRLREDIKACGNDYNSDTDRLFAHVAALREAVLRLLTHRPEHPQAAYEQDEAFALAALEDHLPETKKDEKD